MCVVADFAKMFTIEDYRKNIAMKVAHLDIGVLALNAGYADMGPFHVLDDIEVEKQMQVNAVHCLYTMKVMSKQLLDRADTFKRKSGVIMTSSIAHTVPLCGLSTYSSVKAFTTHLAKCLNYEFKGKIDVMSYNPGVVTTKMSRASQTSRKTISEKRAADVAFKDLGCEVSSAGSFRHDLRTFKMIGYYPISWTQKEMMKSSWVVYERIQKRKAAEA